MNTRKRSHTSSTDIITINNDTATSTEIMDIINGDNIQSAKRAKLSLPRILDGKFFSVDSHVEGKIEARCTECNEVKKGQITSTGNFKNHYRIKHSSTMSALEAYLKGKSDEAVQSQSKPRQPTLNEFSNLNVDKVLVCTIYCVYTHNQIFGRFTNNFILVLVFRRFGEFYCRSKFAIPRCTAASLEESI